MNDTNQVPAQSAPKAAEAAPTNLRMLTIVGTATLLAAAMLLGYATGKQQRYLGIFLMAVGLVVVVLDWLRAYIPAGQAGRSWNLSQELRFNNRIPQPELPQTTSLDDPITEASSQPLDQAIIALKHAATGVGELDRARCEEAQHVLRNMRDAILAHDARLNANELPPMGDDYNDVMAMLGLYEGRVDSSAQ